jgi:hypothetical protein
MCNAAVQIGVDQGEVVFWPAHEKTSESHGKEQTHRHRDCSFE